MIPFEHAVDRCFPGTGRAPDRVRFDALLAEATDGLDWLRRAHDSGSLPLLRLPARTDDLAPLQAIATRFRRDYDTVVVLGTGGSSLGGKTLYSLVDRGFGPPAGTPRICFMENVDPITFADLQAHIDPARTGVVVISKSGSTAETLTQFLVLLQRLQALLSPAQLARAVVAITEAGDNPLRRLAGRIGAEILEHDPKVGGRYSVLSLVGMLPALIAGLDAAAVRRGAASVWATVAGTLAPCPPAVGAALAVAAAEAGLGTTVLMPYVDRLADFGLWYRQLWAESLGKQGRGTTPVRAMGTVDQHSQMQLYLDGPQDKLFTVLTAPSAGVGDPVDPALADDPRLDYLRRRTLGDLLDAEARATFETLVRNGRPSRAIRLARLDEEAMGALFMHFMLETILAARLLGVDPFDQPAVEEGKVLAREYLGKMAAS